MFARRMVTLPVVFLLVSLPAWCGSVNFVGSGGGGTWSWDGWGALTATSLSVDVELKGSSGTYTIADATESFTTGGFQGGAGTHSNPWEFGPSSPWSFELTGCVPPATSCTPTTLFYGQFDKPDDSAVQLNGGILFTASDIYGWVDPALLSFLGLSPSSAVKGSYQIGLRGSGPGSGLTAGGSLSLTQCATPEPASLALIGLGLLGLALVARHRLKPTF